MRNFIGSTVRSLPYYIVGIFAAIGIYSSVNYLITRPYKLHLTIEKSGDGDTIDATLTRPDGTRIISTEKRQIKKRNDWSELSDMADRVTNVQVEFEMKNRETRDKKTLQTDNELNDTPNIP